MESLFRHKKRSKTAPIDSDDAAVAASVTRSASIASSTGGGSGVERMGTSRSSSLNYASPLDYEHHSRFSSSSSHHHPHHPSSSSSSSSSRPSSSTATFPSSFTSSSSSASTNTNRTMMDISSPVNLIPKTFPVVVAVVDAEGKPARVSSRSSSQSIRRENSDRSVRSGLAGAGAVNSGSRSNRSSRAPSPDRQSIRSVSSSMSMVGAAAGEDRNERRRYGSSTNGSLSEYENSVSRAAGGSTEDGRRTGRMSTSSIDAAKPLPISPFPYDSVYHRPATATSSASAYSSSPYAAYQPMPTSSSSSSSGTSPNRPDSRSLSLAIPRPPSSNAPSPLVYRSSTASIMSTASSSFAYPRSSIMQTAATAAPPPPAATIHLLFEDLIAKGDYPPKAVADMRKFDAEKKWLLLSAGGAGGAAGLEKGDRTMKGKMKTEGPESYIAKLIDGSATLQNLASLTVSLRTYDIDWVRSFISLRGQDVLAKSLQRINRLDSQKRLHDPLASTLEAETLKAIKTLFSTEDGAQDAIVHNTSIGAIVASLTSPQLPSRKTALELLLFLNNRDKPAGLNLVLKGFDELQAARGAGAALGRFEIWFTFLEEALDGRGKMGSVVGASDSVMSLRGAASRESARAAANGPLGSVGVLDGQLSEYAMTNMLLISHIISEVTELTVRIHLRAQMEVSGLRRIFDKLVGLQHVNLRRMVDDFIDDAAMDDAEVAEQMKEDVRMNFSDPKGVYEAIVVNTQGRALDFLTSAMKHLLLIPQEGDTRLRYFQLIDKLISSIVTDRKGLDGDFSSLLGSSVATIASRYADQDRLQQALEDAEESRLTVARLKREREELQEEIALKDQGLVGKLKLRNENLERALETSRGANNASSAEFLEKERVYQEKVVSLDLKIRELSSVLLETQGTDWIVPDGDANDVVSRQELVDSYRKQQMRDKAVRLLEGTPKKGKGRGNESEKANLNLVSRSNNALLRNKDEMNEFESSFEDALDLTLRSRTPPDDASRVDSIFDVNRTPQPRRSSLTAPPLPLSTTALPLPSANRSPTLAEEIRSVAHMIGAGPRRRSQLPPDGDGDSDRTNSQLSFSTTASIETTSTSISSSVDSEYTLAPMMMSRNASLESNSPMLNDAGFSIPSSRAGNNLLPAPQFISSHELPLLSFDGTSESLSASSKPNRISSLSSRTNIDPALPLLTSAPEEELDTPCYPPPPPPPPPPPYIRGLPPVASPSTAGSFPTPPQQPAFLAGILKASPASPNRPGMMMSLADLMKGRSGLTKAAARPAGASSPASRSSNGPPPPPAPTFVPRAGGFASRKDPLDMAGRPMKQLQWDKLPPAAVGSTIWGRLLKAAEEEGSDGSETEWSRKLRAEGVFDDMEENFKAKQTFKIAPTKQKKQLISVLKQNQRQRIGITVLPPSSVGDSRGRIKAIVDKILRYDSSLTENFLDSLNKILPDAELEGKLNVYKSYPEEDLETLEEADRLLVECLKIYRLRPRIDAILYRVRFEEEISLLEMDAEKIKVGALSLLNAPHFSQLLKLILMLGNYMNGTGHKGGAFGFKVTSINKLVDTKSSAFSDRTLLHFLAKTVTGSIPQTEAFLEELAAPADAHRSDLANVRVILTDLNTAQRALSTELENADALNEDDAFPKQMIRFSKEAKERLALLTDVVAEASGAYAKALSFYGEDSKSITSTAEFFAVFKTFVTSYQTAKEDNNRTAIRIARAEQIAATKAASLAAIAATAQQGDGLVDSKMRELKASIDSPRVRRVRRSIVEKRAGESAAGQGCVTNGRSSGDREDLMLVKDGDEGENEAEGGNGDDDVDIESTAKNLLAQLNGEGFEIHLPPPPNAASSSSRRRHRGRSRVMSLDSSSSPIKTCIPEENETEE